MLNMKGNSTSIRTKLLAIALLSTGLFAANFMAFDRLLADQDLTAFAVDVSGRQRMLSQKIAYKASMVGSGDERARAQLRGLAKEFENGLAAVSRAGEPKGMRFYPVPPVIRELIRREEAVWRPYKAAALAVADSPAGSARMKKQLALIEAGAEGMLNACENTTGAFREEAHGAAVRMEMIMLLLILASLLLGAAAITFTMKRITGPLFALSAAAGSIAGGSFPELGSYPVNDEMGVLYGAFARMSATIRRYMDRRAAIDGLLSASLQHGSMRELLGKFLETLLKTTWLGIEPKGAIFLTARDGSLHMEAHRGLSDAQLDACGKVAPGRCLCGKAAQSGKTVFYSEAGSGYEISYDGMRPHGHYCLPIKSGEAVIGVLALYLREGHEFDPGEADFLEAVCSIIVKAVEYKRLEENALHTQKLEALGQAAGAIAHDFNNILAGMKGFTQLALEILPEADKAAKYVRETAGGVERGRALVQQLLDFSRKKPADMGDMDLNSLIKDMRPMLAMLVQSRVRIELSLAEGLPAIKGDRGQLEQIIVNLAVNARDAMKPAGGKLLIATGLASGLPGTPAVVKLSVTDTGCGMTKEVADRIFEPFFTTKPEGEGTGLGLATVQSIVELHKGGIEIASAPGKGTTFELSFPVPGDK